MVKLEVDAGNVLHSPPARSWSVVS